MRTPLISSTTTSVPARALVLSTKPSSSSSAVAAVGKTTLIHRLTTGKFSRPKKTEGININEWPLSLSRKEKVQLNVWDFGGQEIMHSTHQFFLTERSLYLLVLSGREGHEDEDAEYWLKLIQSFGGDSPVIVVLNKQGEHPFDVNRGGLLQKYPNVKGFVATECKNGYGIGELRETIKGRSKTITGEESAGAMRAISALGIATSLVRNTR